MKPDEIVNPIAMNASASRFFNRQEQLTHKRACERAVDLQDKGDHQQAVVLLRENLSLSTRVLGVDHFITLNDQDSLSDCLNELGKFEEAAALDRSTLRVRESLNARDYDTLATQHSLANNLSHLGQYDEAIELNRKTLAVREVVLGKTEIGTLETRHNLASNLHRRGQYQEASALNREVLRIREKALAADNYDLIACRHNLATNLHALGDSENALTLTDQNLLHLGNSRPKSDMQLETVVNFQKRVQSDIWKATRVKESQRLQSEMAAQRSRLEMAERMRVQAIANAEASKKAGEKEHLKELQKWEEKLAQQKQREMDRKGRNHWDRKYQEKPDSKGHKEPVSNAASQPAPIQKKSPSLGPLLNNTSKIKGNNPM